MTIANVNRCTGKIIIITISLKIFWCVQWAIILIKEEKVLAMLVVKSFGSCFEIMYEYSLPDLTNLLFYFRVIVEDHWWFKEKMVDLFLQVLSVGVMVVENKKNQESILECQNLEIGSTVTFSKNLYHRSLSLQIQRKIQLLKNHCIVDLMRSQNTKCLLFLCTLWYLIHIFNHHYSVAF